MPLNNGSDVTTSCQKHLIARSVMMQPSAFGVISAMGPARAGPSVIRAGLGDISNSDGSSGV